MDFFQGSTPLNFISFCLENQNIDESQTPTNSTEGTDTRPDSLPDPAPTSSTGAIQDPSLFPFPPPRTVTFMDQNVAESPFSTDSNVDVTAYATEMVQRMEASQARTTHTLGENEEELGLGSNNDPPATPPLRDPRKTSTPTEPGRSTGELPGLSQLESLLQVAVTNSSNLPKLHLSLGECGEEVRSTSLLGEDSPSTVSGPPPLPGGKPLEAESTSDLDTAGVSSGLEDLPLLYGTIPFCAGLESGKDTDTDTDDQNVNLPGTSKAGDSQQEKPLRELSGRSRAILKQYFDTDDPYTFPVGHRTVAFTEPQVYHLLRVLTDEAINMTATTMEQMVIGAVRGKPATAPPRTGQFRSKTQPSMPRPHQSGGSSSEGFLTDPGVDSEGSGDFSALFEAGEFPLLGDSDSAEEMALIADSFKRSTGEQVSLNQQSVQRGQADEGADSTGQSSLDATLSELREETSPRYPQRKACSKKTTRPKIGPRRGVPMREEFFSKIGWVRSFISGPADPLHNPYMVWCHMCKRNFSVRTKGVYEILRHHRSERHLRKDQRWRYEHLKSVDPITGKTQHRVRGRNGKILSKAELARELPKFIHAELVDVGERFPFYEDYLKGNTAAVVTPQSRTKTQISLVGDFIQSQGDLTVLRRLWSRVGAFTNYQAAFHDFDWSEERMSVSIAHTFARVLLCGQVYLYTYM